MAEWRIWMGVAFVIFGAIVLAPAPYIGIGLLCLGLALILGAL